MADGSIFELTDETSRSMRNYSMCAGFMVLFIFYLLFAISLYNGKMLDDLLAGNSMFIRFAFCSMMLICATILILLHKRDLTAIAFIMLGLNFIVPFMAEFYSASKSLSVAAPFYMVLSLLGFAMIFTRNEQRLISSFLLIMVSLPSWMYILNISNEQFVTAIFAIVTFVCGYCVMCIGLDNSSIPFYNALTADVNRPEEDGSPVHFNISGAAVGYALFAIPILGFTLAYCNVPNISLADTFVLETSCGLMLVIIGILMLIAGRMKFTPFMFMMLGSITMLSAYITDVGQVSFLLMLIVGFSVLMMNDGKKLFGYTIILYGCSYLISGRFDGVTNSSVSILLNVIPFLICMYICFALFSDNRLKMY